MVPGHCGCMGNLTEANKQCLSLQEHSSWWADKEIWASWKTLSSLHCCRWPLIAVICAWNANERAVCWRCDVLLRRKSSDAWTHVYGHTAPRCFHVFYPPANLQTPDGEQIVFPAWCNINGSACYFAALFAGQKLEHRFHRLGSGPEHCSCRIQGNVNVGALIKAEVWEEKWISRVTRAGVKDRTMDLLPYRNLLWAATWCDKSPADIQGTRSMFIRHLSGVSDWCF